MLNTSFVAEGQDGVGDLVEIGMGLGIGVTRLMVHASRTPRFVSRS